MFGILDNSFQCLPIFQTSCCPIIVEGFAALFCPPLLGVFLESRAFCVLGLCSIDRGLNMIDNTFQIVFVGNIGCFKVFEN